MTNKVYTARELAFVKVRRKMPRRDLLRAFKRKFRRPGFSLLRLQDLCNRHGWGVGARKGRNKGRSSRYSKAELAFIGRRRKMARRELHASFVKKFRRHDVSADHIKQLCTRHGWRAPSDWRTLRMTGRTKFSKAERLWLKRRQTMPRREFWAAYVGKFGREISLEAFKALGDRLGLRTGRTGRIEKGHVPANKGKQMPFNANSAATRFKKGNRTGRANQVYKPIGTERFSKEGYLERKIHDDLPMQSRWRAVHIVNWEALHGAVPAGHCLKCLDGNKVNTDPSNWELISRAVLARLNKSRNRYDAASAELKPTIMAIAKLRDRIGDKLNQRTT
jgi:hypothetical protein